jgi:hypothetical protein
MSQENPKLRQSTTPSPVRRLRIYTMGSADCRSYSRNKRGIAGGLIWINFDRHSLLNLFKKAAGKFVADVDEIRPQYQDPSVGSQAVFTSSLVRNVGPSIGSTIDQLDNLTVTEVGGTKELASPWYSDQILPFDITIAGANEYGAMAGQLPRSSAWKSSTKVGAPRSMTLSAKCRWALVARAGGLSRLHRIGPSLLLPLPPPSSSHSRGTGSRPIAY